MIQGDDAEISLDREMSVSLIRTGDVGGDINLVAGLTGLGFLIVLCIFKAKCGYYLCVIQKRDRNLSLKI